MMTRIVCLTGTHCTGKSTTLNDLKMRYPTFNNRYIAEGVQEIHRQGFPINEASTQETQLALCSYYEQEYKNAAEKQTSFYVFGDRSPIDVYAYTLRLFAYNKITPAVLMDIRDRATNFIERYNPYIFWFRPEFELVENGTRSVNKEFQEVIDKIFEFILEHQNVYLIQGTREARLRTIDYYIRKFDNV